MARIKAYDHAYGSEPAVNAVILLNPEAITQAKELDAERPAGKIRGPVHGMPIVVKDNYNTADMPTTDGSEALKDFQPHRDATIITRLRQAGAIILAKTNLHESAAGVTTISSLGVDKRRCLTPPLSAASIWLCARILIQGGVTIGVNRDPTENANTGCRTAG